MNKKFMWFAIFHYCNYRTNNDDKQVPLEACVKILGNQCSETDIPGQEWAISTRRPQEASPLSRIWFLPISFLKIGLLSIVYYLQTGKQTNYNRGDKLLRKKNNKYDRHEVYYVAVQVSRIISKLQNPFRLPYR